MKHFKNIFSFASFLVLFLLSSCLDNTGNLDVFNSVNNKGIISIGQAEATGENVKAIEISATPLTVSVVINAARINKAVNVTLEVNPDALKAYNETQTELVAGFVPFELLPASLYTIPSLTVQIPGGKLDVPFEFQVTTATISLTKKYMLPLTIKSVDDPSVVIASNLNTSLVAIVLKNEFDGIYSITGEVFRYGVDPAGGYDPVLGYDPTLSGKQAAGACEARPLATLSKFSVSFDPLWKNCSGIGGIGTPTITVDPTVVDANGRYKVTMSATANATLRNLPGKENSYDPVTKTFRLFFVWGAGGALPPTINVRTVEAVLVYERKR